MRDGMVDSAYHTVFYIQTLASAASHIETDLIWDGVTVPE